MEGNLRIMTTLTPKTEPWQLESGMIIHFDGNWQIRVGGAQQPEYHVTGETLEEAIQALVKAVTRDAIEDEAREWQQTIIVEPEPDEVPAFRNPNHP